MLDRSCYVVDAFTREAFSGNPAAVVPLDEWLPDATLQAIAAEMNLSETAFFAREPGTEADLRLRWFTPRVEVDLCGHATLASAHVLFERVDPSRREVRFHTRSGALVVTRATEDGELRMDFPSRPPEPVATDPAVAVALGVDAPLAMLRSRDLIVVVERAEQVRRLAPDLGAVARLPDVFAVAVTAAADGRDADVDFVSRFFAPAKGVPEDPVTGSAHCSLAPYWAARLGKDRLRARQVGPRGGELSCDVRGDRVTLGGHAVLVLEGRLRA